MSAFFNCQRAHFLQVSVNVANNRLDFHVMTLDFTCADAFL